MDRGISTHTLYTFKQMTPRNPLLSPVILNNLFNLNSNFNNISSNCSNSTSSSSSFSLFFNKNLNNENNNENLNNNLNNDNINNDNFIKNLNNDNNNNKEEEKEEEREWIRVEAEEWNVQNAWETSLKIIVQSNVISKIPLPKKLFDKKTNSFYLFGNPKNGNPQIFSNLRFNFSYQFNEFADPKLYILFDYLIDRFEIEVKESINKLTKIYYLLQFIYFINAASSVSSRVNVYYKNY